MNRPCNDDITPIFDWLYIGGVRNTRKTLPLVDVWYDFKWDTGYLKNFVVPDHVDYHHIPFDDGGLTEALPIWEKCFNEILIHKSQNKKIFVSCYEGVSRSAVLCLWLVCYELGDYALAYEHVRKCRNIYPDKSFYPFLDELKIRYTK